MARRFFGQSKQLRAEKISIFKVTYIENADSLINHIKVARAESVKMSVERNMISARFEEHVCALHTLGNANVQRKVSLTEAIAKVRNLLESVRSIDNYDYSMKVSGKKK